MTWTLLDTLARWLHLLGILTWMGHNYANVIQHPRYQPVATQDEAAVASLVSGALKREHGTFRYASLVTLASGLFMLWNRGLLVDVLSLSGDAAVIGIGVWIGVIMVLNLWFILWPHQKKVLGFVAATREERVRCSRITFLSSRTNTILSFPALFFMLTGAHGIPLYL